MKIEVTKNEFATLVRGCERQGIESGRCSKCVLNEWCWVKEQFLEDICEIVSDTKSEEVE